MPIRHSIIHQICKKPDGSRAVLQLSNTQLAECQATENLLHDLNVAYNSKTGKTWVFFCAQYGAFPFSGWLHSYIEGGNFTEFSHTAVEHLQKLMEESNLSVGGHVLLAHAASSLEGDACPRGLKVTTRLESRYYATLSVILEISLFAMNRFLRSLFETFSSPNTST